MAIDRSRNSLTATVDVNGRVVNRWKKIDQGPSTAQMASIPQMRTASAGTDFADRPDCPDGWIDLFHRTSLSSADAVYDSGQMFTKEVGETVYFSSFDGSERDAQGEGYGDSVVWIRVPEDEVMLDDEFPSGELHYQVPLSLISKDALMGRVGFEGPQVEDAAPGIPPAALRSLVKDITENAHLVSFRHHGDEDAIPEWYEMDDEEITLELCEDGAVAANNCHIASSTVLENELDDLPAGMSAELFGVMSDSGNHTAIAITDREGSEWVLDYTMRQFSDEAPFPFLGSRDDWTKKMITYEGELEPLDLTEGFEDED